MKKDYSDEFKEIMKYSTKATMISFGGLFLMLGVRFFITPITSELVANLIFAAGIIGVVVASKKMQGKIKCPNCKRQIRTKESLKNLKRCEYCGAKLNP